MDTGSRLRLRGEGSAGRRGGEPGDLYVFISVRSHPKLKREGTTIHSDVEISYIDAILGSTVQASQLMAIQGLVNMVSRLTSRCKSGELLLVTWIVTAI